MLPAPGAIHFALYILHFAFCNSRFPLTCLPVGPEAGIIESWEVVMIRTSLLVAMAAFGSDVGWRQLPEGGTEYIIQLNESELDALRRHGHWRATFRPAPAEVRAYRIIVGTRNPAAWRPRHPDRFITPHPPSRPTAAGRRLGGKAGWQRPRQSPGRPDRDGWLDRSVPIRLAGDGGATSAKLKLALVDCDAMGLFASRVSNMYPRAIARPPASLPHR